MDIQVGDILEMLVEIGFWCSDDKIIVVYPGEYVSVTKVSDEELGWVWLSYWGIASRIVSYRNPNKWYRKVV